MNRKTLFMVGGALLLGFTARLQAADTASLAATEPTAKEPHSASATGRLKVSGYIQAQYQWGEAQAALKVGSGNENGTSSFHRIGLRRGRLKVVFGGDGIASGVFQIDMTEKGLALKDAYMQVTDPWWHSLALRAGVFNRPFGQEIGFSSARRESPERATVFQTLFPEERDLGLGLVLQAPQTSPWHVLRLEAGLFAGNGIRPETDSRKDFIGHLSIEKTLGHTVHLGAGVSYYHGGVFQGTDSVYTMHEGGFVPSGHPSHKGQFARREYVGFDLQVSLPGPWGTTQLRAEYLFGQQPAAREHSKSPNAPERPAHATYLRPFRGGYVLLVQDLGRLPWAVVVKYDWYDPNTRIAGDAVGGHLTGRADLGQSTLGMGALWHIKPSLRLQAFYEWNRHELSAGLPDRHRQPPANVFTLRLQYRF
jgi:phosphate-selective porin